MGDLQRPVASIDRTGHLTVSPYRHPEDGLLTLVFHLETTQAVAFLFRALRASDRLKVISMLPIQGDRVEALLDLTTPDRAVSFLIQLKMVFSAVEERETAA